jgi:hypothetical protein
LGVAAVEKDGSWGFIDLTGNIVVSPKYIDLRETKEGLIPVCNANAQWGFIDLSGKISIAFKYDDANSFSHGLAPVASNGRYFFIDKKGNQTIDGNFIFASPFNSDGFAHVLVSRDEGYIIDTLGIKYEYLGGTFYNLPSEGIYQQRLQNGKWGFYDVKTKKNIIPHEYDLVYQFSNGLAPVKKGMKWGYIDIKNQLIIEYKFDDANPFSEGLAAVKLNGKKGYINMKGEVVILPQFDTAADFKNGVAEVEKESIVFYINKSGILLKD